MIFQNLLYYLLYYFVHPVFGFWSLLATKLQKYENIMYSNLTNIRVGPFNCVGARFLRN